MKKVIVLAALLAASGSAVADSITGNYDGGITANIFVYPTGGGQGGALLHTWSGGTGQAAQYNGQHYTFCSDLQFVVDANRTFNLVAVTSAPVNPSGNPGEGTAYTTTEADRVNAWMTAAKSLGLVDHRGFFNNSSHTINSVVYSNTDISYAMQFGVWDSLWDDTNPNPWDSAAGEVYMNGAAASVLNAIAAIRTVALTKLGGPMITRILASDQAQDQVVLVPLPPAAWAGLGSLGMVAGVGYFRRRGQRA